MRRRIKQSFAGYFTLAIALVLASASLADTYTWVGGTGTFGTLSNWQLASTGEAPEVAPGPNDNVIIPNAAAAYTVTTTARFEIGSLTLGGGEGAGYPTLNFNNGVLTNVVAGTVTIASGAKLKHNINDSATQRKLCLKCHDMTIASGGQINVDNMGPHYKGVPSQPSYGGAGGIDNSNTHVYNQRCRGSIRHPTLLGGNGGLANQTPSESNATVSYKCGGAIYLEVEGTLAVNGSISALSQSGAAYYNGTGGSIYIKAGTLSGSASGMIDASAGVNSTSAGGGGGRIAVYESVATSFGGYAGKFRAYGGRSGNKNTAGCGTIYLEHAADTAGQGTLIVDNGANNTRSDLTTPGNQYYACRMDTQMVDEDQVFGTVIVTNNAYLRIANGVTFRVSKRLCTLGATLTCETGSTVEFTGSEDALIEGANSFYHLKCTTPGKTLRFGTGAANKTSIQSGGVLTLAGEEGSFLNLRSKTAGTQWQLSIGANSSVDVHHCDVMDSNASFGVAVINFDGTGGDSENNVSWSSFPTPVLGALNTWTGGAGTTSWTKDGNWSLGRQPVDTDCLVIPAGCPVYPTIASTITVNSLTNEAGGSLSISGANLEVTNAFVNLGTFTAGASNQLIFNGVGVQDVDLGNSSYGRVTISKPSGEIRFAKGFTAKYLRCRASNALALSFAAGQTVDVEVLSLYGLSGSDATTRLLTLSSSSPGTAWKLKATKFNHLRGVTVSDCDATLGETIVVGDLGTDNGGNTGWNFSSGAAAEWIGVSGSLNTAANWLPSGVPGASTQVTLCPPVGSTWSPTQSAALSFGELVTGCAGGTLTPVFSKKLTVSGGLYVGEKATLTINYFSEANVIGGDVLLANGGVLTHAASTAGTEAAKLWLNVGGDVTIPQGCSINVKAKGFPTGKGTGFLGGTHGSSYASVGIRSDSSTTFANPYGSILHPFNLGSGSNYSGGGGAVRIEAAGDITINGTVDASGQNSSYTAGTGGSIWLSGSNVSGSGTINAKAGTHGGSHDRSSGGRIAIYRTGTEGWDGFNFTVTCGGRAPGTYYREDSTGEGELRITECTGSNNGTWLPMPNDGVARNAFRDVAVTVGANCILCVKNASLTTGSTVKIRDLHLSSSSAKVRCHGNFLRVLSKTHKNGNGWVSGNYATRISNGSITLSDGAIVWSAGFSVYVR